MAQKIGEATSTKVTAIASNGSAANLQAMEAATGKRIETELNEQSLPMSQKRREKYD